MADFFDSYARGLQVGQQQKQRNQLAELQNLAPQVMSGDLDATSRAFSLDPTRAQAYQTEGNRQQQQLVGLAKTLKQFANNPQMQAGVYRSALPYLKRNFGAEIPDDFDPAAVMPIVDQVLAVANNTPNFNGQTPTDVRSFQMMTQGLSPEELERARRINLGLAGRESSAAIGYQKVKGPDGVERLVAVDPRQIGAQVVGDGTGYGSFSEPAQPHAAQAGNHFGAFSQLATEFPSVTMTSGVRSAERNAQVGGQPNSQHLNGTAADYAVPANQKPAFISRARQLGYQAIDEGDHIHLQLPRGSTGSGPNMFAGRRPEDEAAAIEAAKAGVENANFPNRLEQERQLQGVKTQGAITQAAGTAAAEAEAKDASQRPKRIQQYRQALTAAGNVETSLDKALGLLSPYSTGFVGARSRSIEGSPSYNLASELETIKANLGFDRLQQMRDSSPTGGALGAIAVQELVALQSTIANLDPNQSEEQIRANLDRVKTHYKNWRSAVQQSLADEERAQKAQPASAPSGRSIARRGRAPDGRTVIQYSDGTIEYGN